MPTNTGVIEINKGDVLDDEKFDFILDKLRELQRMREMNLDLTRINEDEDEVFERLQDENAEMRKLLKEWIYTFSHKAKPGTVSAKDRANLLMKTEITLAINEEEPESNEGTES